MTDEFLVQDLPIGFLQGKTSTAIGRRLQRNLKTAYLEITQEQFSILCALWDKDGLTQQEISVSTFKDKPSITRLLDNLEKLDLVIRKDHPSDRRTNIIYLTKKAKDIQNQALKIANQTLKEALMNISEENLAICKEVLAQILHNLQSE